MNNVVLFGRLSTEPELRYTTTGMAVCTAKIAVDRYKRGGEAEQAADFIWLKLFDRMAENFSAFHTKGSRALVFGRITVSSWKTNNDEWRSKTEVVVDRFETVNTKEQTLALRAKNQADAEQQNTAPPQQQKPARQQAPINGQLSGTYNPNEPQHDPQYEGFTELDDGSVPF